MSFLQKYQRLPKIYITLPSQGKYQPQENLQGSFTDIPVFSMSGFDELTLKTPDALFNGTATADVIKSCIPTIKDPKKLPTIDIDVCLIAMRIASYGEEITMSSKCPHCGTDNDHSCSLTKMLEHYNNLEWQDTVKINDLTFHLKPLDYETSTKFNQEQYVYRKQLAADLSGMTEEDKDKFITEQFKKLANLQSKTVVSIIDYVEGEGESESDKQAIVEFIKNSDLLVYSTIKSHIEKQNELWKIPAQQVSCSECAKEYKLNITFDQSDFFVSA